MAIISLNKPMSAVEVRIRHGGWELGHHVHNR